MKSDPPKATSSAWRGRRVALGANLHPFKHQHVAKVRDSFSSLFVGHETPLQVAEVYPLVASANQGSVVNWNYDKN
jgi:hypothetical protein